MACADCDTSVVAGAGIADGIGGRGTASIERGAGALGVATFRAGAAAASGAGLAASESSGGTDATAPSVLAATENTSSSPLTMTPAAPASAADGLTPSSRKLFSSTRESVYVEPSLTCGRRSDAVRSAMSCFLSETSVVMPARSSASRRPASPASEMVSAKGPCALGVVIVRPVKGEERRSPGVAEPVLDARAVAAMAS